MAACRHEHPLRAVWCGSIAAVNPSSYGLVETNSGLPPA